MQIIHNGETKFYVMIYTGSQATQIKMLTNRLNVISENATDKMLASSVIVEVVVMVVVVDVVVVVVALHTRLPDGKI